MDKEALVDQVKSLQRSDPQAKQLWWDHCDQNLGGVRDPNRHDAAVLQDFLNASGYSGYSPSPVAPAPRPTRSSGMGKGSSPGHARGGGYDDGYGQAYGGGPGMMMQGGWGGGCGWGGGAMAAPMMGGGMPGGGDLVGLVKAGQRASSHWKVAWQTYCGLYGSGFNDPAKYDAGYITGFLDYVAQLAEADLGIAAQHAGLAQPQMMMGKGGPPAAGMKRSMPVGSYGGPPAKKAALGGSGDGEKAEMVDRVKALQRRDPGTKEAWWKYCDEQLGGVRDPARHEKDVLQAFLQNHE